MDAFDLGVSLLKAVILIAILLTGFAYTTLLERKVIARMQQRIGPNRAGPMGLLQPLADGIKLVFKENFTPRGVDRLPYFLAPVLSLVVALMAFAVVPIADPVTFEWAGVERSVTFQVADLDIGILYILGITSLAVYGIALAGWSSNSTYSLLGGLRSSAQMVSYELALGVSLIGVVMIAGTLSLAEIVELQRDWPLVLVQPLGFVLYAVSAVAETNRAPFDMPEAEQELIAGYHTEYTGLRFAMFFMAEYMNMITVSAIATVLFLGGHHLPWVGDLPWYLDIVVFTAKVVAGLFVFVWLRATLPRLRYDQLMDLGWKVLLPLALLNVALTGLGLAWWQLLR